MDEQKEQLTRVYSTISDAVLAFVTKCLDDDKTFHIEELREYVAGCGKSTAPNSAYRILYQLKKDQRCDYSVINRHKSLYRIEWVAA